jgi:hypothetical protein
MSPRKACWDKDRCNGYQGWRYGALVGFQPSEGTWEEDTVADSMGFSPAKSVFEFGIFHPGRQNCIDSIDYKRSTLIVAPSYQSQHRRLFFCDRNSFMKHENQLRFHRILFRCS